MSTQSLNPRRPSTVKRALVGIALVTLVAALPARAAAVGATDVDISIPDIVILHYFTDVDVTITSDALGTYLTGSPGDAILPQGTSAPAPGGFDQDLALTPSALTGDPASVELILRNAWAVRSISMASGTLTQVAIANTDATLEHTTTSAEITVSAAVVDDGTTLGPSISFASPGLTTPTIGDVRLTLDLTAATNAGDYVDGVYTLTATNI